MGTKFKTDLFTNLLYVTGIAASLAVLSFLYVKGGIPLGGKVFPKTNSGTSDHNMELAESSRQRQKKESSGIPWNILVVPRQDINNKALFRKCCSKYARHHRREYFHKSLFSRMEAIQKTSNYETRKYRNRHCFNVSFDLSIFKICS